MGVLEKIGFGVVQKDMLKGAKDLYAIPLESLSEYTGSILDSEESNAQVMSGGKPKQGSVVKDMVVHATRCYDPSGSHRGSVPRLKRGELIELWQVKGDDVFFWSLFEYQPDLRGKEPVVHIISGNTDEHGVTLNQENSHYYSYDPDTKEFILHFSNNDGEPVGFDAVFNLKEGVYFLKDTNGNYVKHNGKEGIGETYFRKQNTLKSPKIILDGETYVTKNLHVTGNIDDSRGDLTGHSHDTTDGATAKPR